MNDKNIALEKILSLINFEYFFTTTANILQVVSIYFTKYAAFKISFRFPCIMFSLLF